MIGIDHAEACVRPSEVFRGERTARVAFEVLFERNRFGSAVEGHCSLDPPWPELWEASRAPRFVVSPV